MRLTKISITGFRSFMDQTDISFDQSVNVLIGANDHGKTNLLEAIRCLNDNRPIIDEDRNWDLVENKIPRIEWHFKVSNNEKKTIASKNPKEDANAENLFLVNNDNEIVFFREGINTPVKLLSTPIKVSKVVETEILNMRPKIELFEAPKSNVLDRVNRGTISSPQYEFMQGIFMLAGIWDKLDKIFKEDDVNSKILDEASEKLTTILQTDWNQGKTLRWILKPTGNNGDHIEIKIQDPSVKGRYSRPSLKSSGFQSYFLISMMILARTKNSKQKNIFLFDEPGTYLHPQAQLDLQRSFELISIDTQIFYSTHSMFLINKNYPERNKVISKTQDGTKVDQKPFLKNWKSVRESLGILLSNNFLIAEKTLLVEGPSDIIYILNSIKNMKTKKLVDVDLNDISIVDAGDRSNYIAMAKLMLSEGRAVVAQVDGDKWGRETIAKLKIICESEIRHGQLQFLELPEKHSVEDVFTDIDFLHRAILEVAKSIVDSGIRKFKSGTTIENVQKLIGELNGSEADTLGNAIDTLTKSLFEEGEKLSKLSIALKYEDLIRENLQDYSPTLESQKILISLKKILSLKGEKSTDSGVFNRS